MEFKVGDTVYSYMIELNFSKGVAEQEVKEYKILGVNENNLCIDSFYFNTFRYKPLYRGEKTDFNKPSIVDMTDVYCDYIRCYLYTTDNNKSKSFARVKEKLEEYINERVGRYGMAKVFK